MDRTLAVRAPSLKTPVPTMTRLLLLHLAILMTVAGAGCSVGKGREAAERAVLEFHQRLDAEQYDQIYTTASDDFRASTSQSDSTELFAAVHRKLGKVLSAHQRTFAVNTTLTGTSVRLQYDTEFAEGKATEAFVFTLSGDKATLFSYNINSPTLITK